jgi:DNA-binding transcriptional regulator GbsR (MarR family)
MSDLNTNDYRVLNMIVDIENNLGNSRLRGRTVDELVNSTGLSTTKVRSSLKKLIESGFIGNGIKRIKSNTFHITQIGSEELESIKTDIIDMNKFEEE